MKSTLVIGASENTARYSNIAIKMLRDHHIETFGYGLKEGKVEDVEIFTDQRIVPIDTVSLYVGPNHQDPIKDYIYKLKPRRVIFNPGTENIEFERELNNRGIETEEACTLVLLSTNAY
jgi:predicted CoA-binding protein